MNLYTKLAALLIAICCFNMVAKAQYEPGYVLSGEVENAKSHGIVFQPYTLFNITSAAKHTNVLSKETLLMPDKDAISKLYTAYPKAIALTLKTDDGQSFVLELMKSSPLAATPNMGYFDANGSHKCGYEKAVHYQGSIKGIAKSIASISVFANGEVMALFAGGDGNYVLGKVEDNSGLYVLYNDKDFTVAHDTKCGVDDYAAYTKNVRQNAANKTTAAYECNKLRLYWEADFALYKAKTSSVTNTQNYLIGMFNNIQALYRNERIAIELKSVYVWTVNDGYDSTASSDALSDFRTKWNAKADTFDGDLAMLMAIDPGGLGGIAYLDVLCSRNFCYAYGDVHGTGYSTIPTYSWDVEMPAHEIGHNIGSKHTHWCGWNTGGSGVCGSIDNCTTQENGSSCNNCYFVYDNGLPPTSWKGTIMSYCHLTTRGIDLANGFGPLPGDVLRTNIASSSCLQSIISAKLTPIPICKGKGAIMLSFDTTGVGTGIGSKNFGAAMYTYSWSHGSIAQNATTLGVAGSYSVTITDSNGCSKTYSTTLTTNTADSCKTTGGGSAVNNVYGTQQYVSLYPNPAHQDFAMKFYAVKNTAITIKVVDVVGKATLLKYVQAKEGENDVTVDISGWSKGVYFVQLQSANEHYESVKLVVE